MQAKNAEALQQANKQQQVCLPEFQATKLNQELMLGRTGAASPCHKRL
jgi:hypothetical protein